MLRIAIDGPGGAGKSTIAKLLAKELGIDYIDTGAMYRAAALKMTRLGITAEDPEEVRSFSQTANVYINHIAFSKEDGHWVFWYMDHPMIVVKARAFSFEL